MLDAPLIDLAAFDWTDWADDPYPLYRRLRDEAPVFWDERNQTYVLTRYEDVYRVLLDHKGCSSVPLDILEGRQPPTSEIRQQDQPRHGFIRNIVAPLFNPSAMRRREEIIRAIVRDLVDRIEDDDVVEVSTAIATPLPGTVALGLIGLPQEHHARFNELMDERLAFLLTRGSRAESSPVALAELRPHPGRHVGDRRAARSPSAAPTPSPMRSHGSSRSRTRSARTSSPTTSSSTCCSSSSRAGSRRPST